MVFFLCGLYLSVIGAAIDGRRGFFMSSLAWALFGAFVVCVRYWMKRKF
jgi:hypothetical protein